MSDLQVELHSMIVNPAHSADVQCEWVAENMVPEVWNDRCVVKAWF
jgi:hypothetical protein